VHALSPFEVCSLITSFFFFTHLDTFGCIFSFCLDTIVNIVVVHDIHYRKLLLIHILKYEEEDFMVLEVKNLIGLSETYRSSSNYNPIGMSM